MISNYQSSFHTMKSNNIRSSYDRFHSQCNEISHAISDTEHQLDKQFHIKYHVQTLLSHFKRIFMERGFKVTEAFPGKIMLVKLTFCDRINYIFLNKQPKHYMLTITTQEFKSMRKVNISRLTKNHPILNFSQLQEIYQIIQDNPLEDQQDNENRDDTQAADYHQDMYSLEATSTYMYHKIFVDGNYSIGKKMKKLLDDNKSIPLVDAPKNQSSLIIGGIREITEDMLKNFNCTRKQLLEILCHCRKTVEDFYHDRRFKLSTKQKIDLERGSIEAEVMDKIPQTVKAFHRMLAETNSISLLRLIFLCHFVFELQCEVLNYSQSQISSLGTKLGQNFTLKLNQKIKILKLWGYSHITFDEYLHPFLSNRFD